MTENLSKHLEQLSSAEQAVLVRVIQFNKQWADVHRGMLPFLPYNEVINWYRAWVLGNELAIRIHHRILSKLVHGRKSGHVVDLDDAKVFRRFGKHPERGVNIPTLETIHRYRDRRPFERTKDAYDVRAQTVALKHVGHNRWIIWAQEGPYPKVLEWLTDNCR